MKIIVDKITAGELKELAQHIFENMIKGVVDIKREVLALDADLHSDLEALLLDDGSEQKDLWGINLYPGADESQYIEFDSMINLRPSQGNHSRGVDDEKIRSQIIAVVHKRISS